MAGCESVNTVVLLDLLQLYEKELCSKIFSFKLSNGQVIKLRFFREQLCHLLGIQHIYENNKKYLGASGYEKILTGKITVPALKKHNKSEYAKIKERLEHFDEIPELLMKGSLIRFYQERANPKTKIRAEICIFHEKQTYMLHLFLSKEGSTDGYAPTSFVIKFCNDDAYRQFTQNQEYKRVIERTVEMVE